jgi:BlaI family transcriptional regulator, penicillinase repressor
LTFSFTGVIIVPITSVIETAELEMKASVAISEAESVVMEVLWRLGPMRSENVVERLTNHQQWREPTIKTLLNRLLNKGAISAEKDGRRYVYSPVLTRDEWLSRESKGLLDRLFGGRVAPLVAHFGRHGKLSKKDIAELKRMIAEMDDG